MLARYSFRELAHRPLRTLLALAGVSVATAMLVDMLMLAGGIERSFGELLESRGYEIRVSPKGTLPFDTEATIAGHAGLRDSLLAVPGVGGAAPLLAASVSLAADPGDPVRALALGIDPLEQGVLRLTDGRPPERGEILMTAEAAARLGVALGDAVRLSMSTSLGVGAPSDRFVVSGTAEFLYASRRELPVALPLEDLQRLAGAPDRVSFLMLRTAPGVDPDETAASVRRALPRVETVAVAGLVAQASRRLSYFRQLALILGTVSLGVTALLVGTIMAVSISERQGIIAALRAIGISRLSILRALTAESVVLCGAAGLLGLGLGVVVAAYLETILSDFPGLPSAVRFFVLRPERLVTAYVVLLATGAVAALIPAWRATQLEIAGTLHADEP